jgi:hypothetical protein
VQSLERPWRYVPSEECIHNEIVALFRTLDTIPNNLVVHLDSAAIDLAKTFWHSWADAAADSSPARAAFLGKLRGYSVRIAGVLQLLDLAEQATANGITNLLNRDGDSRSTTASMDVMRRALQISAFYLAQFDALQPEMGADDLPAEVARFLRRVEDKKLKSVTPRDLQQWKILAKGTKADGCVAFLKDLADRWQRG